jgi:hypothetical protein
MNQEQLQASAARDQFWSGLRVLLPDIQGEMEGSERQRQVVQLLARVVVAELQFRAERAEPD